MRLVRLLGLAATAAVPVFHLPAASAAEATAAGAAALAATFETYLGRTEAGTPPVVTVTPSGEAYDVDLDLDALSRPLKALGLDLRAGRWRTTLTPLADGTWRQRIDSIGPVTVAVPNGQTIEVRFDGLAATGTFDPALAAFTSQTLTARALSSRSSKPASGDEPGVETEAVRNDLRIDAGARAAASGTGVDVDARQTSGKGTQTIAITGGTAQGVPDMTFTISVEETTADIGLAGLRTVGLRDLWAHLVARHAREDFTAGQGALKARIRDALPLFERFRQSVSAHALSVETPFGFGGIREIGGRVDGAGLVRDGTFDVAMHVAGVEVHSMLMPAWIGRLLPTDAAITVKGSGYDLATPLSVFLDRADFAADAPLSPEDGERIKGLLLPRGTMEIDLAGNRLAGAGWEATLDGRLTVGEKGAVGALTVRATGLDAVERILADPKTGDQGRQARAALEVATALAERRPDGLVWRFDVAGDTVSVNGRPLSSGKAAPTPETPAPNTPAPQPKGGGKPKQQTL